MAERRISRRDFMRRGMALAEGAAAAAFLAACGGGAKGQEATPARTAETSSTRVEASPTVEATVTPIKELASNEQIATTIETAFKTSPPVPKGSGAEGYTFEDQGKVPGLRKQWELCSVPNPTESSNQDYATERINLCRRLTEELVELYRATKYGPYGQAALMITSRVINDASFFPTFTKSQLDFHRNYPTGRSFVAFQNELIGAGVSLPR